MSGTPAILIVDDLFGRTTASGRNEERASLCGHLLLEDATGDHGGGAGAQRILRPTARAFFHRGQTPAKAVVGDIVSNDPAGVLRAIREHGMPGPDRISLVLLDLCFHTGRVTQASDRETPGMPEGAPEDAAPGMYFGLSLLPLIRGAFPDLPVVVLSSQTPDAATLSAVRGKAAGFLPRHAPEAQDLLRGYLLDAGQTGGNTS